MNEKQKASGFGCIGCLLTLLLVPLAAVVVFVIFGLWLGESRPNHRAGSPRPNIRSPRNQEVQPQEGVAHKDIDVDFRSFREAGGMWIYLFRIRNDGDRDFEGDVVISVQSTDGRNLGSQTVTIDTQGGLSLLKPSESLEAAVSSAVGPTAEFGKGQVTRFRAKVDGETVSGGVIR